MLKKYSRFRFDKANELDFTLLSAGRKFVVKRMCSRAFYPGHTSVLYGSLEELIDTRYYVSVH